MRGSKVVYLISMIVIFGALAPLPLSGYATGRQALISGMLTSIMLIVMILNFALSWEKNRS
jgi:hypothetical protein